MCVVMYVGIAVDMIPSIRKYVHKYIYVIYQMRGPYWNNNYLILSTKYFSSTDHVNGKYLIYFFSMRCSNSLEFQCANYYLGSVVFIILQVRLPNTQDNAIKIL